MSIIPVVGATTASTTAIALSSKRNKVVSKVAEILKDKGATSEKKAVKLSEQIKEKTGYKESRWGEIVKKTEDGKYWVDENLQNTLRMIQIIAVVVMLLVLVAICLFVGFLVLQVSILALIFPA